MLNIVTCLTVTDMSSLMSYLFRIFFGCFKIWLLVLLIWILRAFDALTHQNVLMQTSGLSHFYSCMWTSGYFRTTLNRSVCGDLLFVHSSSASTSVDLLPGSPNINGSYSFTNKPTIRTTRHCSWFGSWMVPVFDFCSSL